MEFKLRPLILTVYLPAFLTAMSIGMLAPIIPAKVDLIGGTVFVIGLAVGARGLGEAIFSIPTGVLIIKLGNKNTMLLGMIGMSVFALLSGITDNNLILYIWLFCLGIFYGFFSLSRHSFLTQIVPRAFRGKAFSRFGGINRIGWFFGPVIGGFTAGSIGVNIPFYIVAAISLLTTFIILFGHDPSSYINANGHVDKTPESTLNTFKAHKQSFAIGGTAQFIMQFLRECRHVLIPVWAFSIGLEVEQLGIIQSLSSAIDMTLFYPVGIVMDRFGRKWTSLPSILLLATGFIIMTSVDSFTGLLLVSLLLGFANGLGSGAMLTLGADLSPSINPSAFLGIWRVFGWTGNSAGGPVSGSIAQLFGLTASSLVVAAIGLVGVGIFAFLIPETLSKKQNNPIH